MSTTQTAMPVTCAKGTTFEECELEILHNAVSRAESKQKKQAAYSKDVKDIMKIVEKFISRKQLIVYGGTAQNNILPKRDQFYDPNTDIPDYDFFSPNALDDAKELADVYAKAGYLEVDAKAGVHHGTYKVFVNFIPTADVTQIPQGVYDVLKKDAVKKNGILYAPPNFLRMGMYLELSRPNGDVSRWEKVYKRLILLNKNYPLTSHKCTDVSFQRALDAIHTQHKSTVALSAQKNNEEVYSVVLKALLKSNVVFFGGYALSKYFQYMPVHVRRKLEKIPDFDVLSEDPDKTAQNVKDALKKHGYQDVTITRHSNIGEIVSNHLEVQIDEDTVVFIYEPNACHSYNALHEDGHTIRVATIDTMLSYYLAFLYADKPYYDPQRILCMAKYLMKVQENNRLSQRGLLKRFSISCMGHQETLEEIRDKKSKVFARLSKDPKSREYQEWFFRYRPHKTNKTRKRKTQKKSMKKAHKKAHKKTHKKHKK